MVEERGENVEERSPRLDQLLQPLSLKGGPIDGRQEDGLHLVVAELVGGQVGRYQCLEGKRRGREGGVGGECHDVRLREPANLSRSERYFGVLLAIEDSEAVERPFEVLSQVV